MLFLNSFGQLSPEEIVDNNELQNKVVYMGLDSIESNGVSNWLRKLTNQRRRYFRYYPTPYKPSYFAVHYYQRFLLMRVGRKNFKNSFFKDYQN